MARKKKRTKQDLDDSIRESKSKRGKKRHHERERDKRKFKDHH